MPSPRSIVAFLFALLSTCVFGQMSYVASAGLFENPSPTDFQLHAGLWLVLYWLLPALTIGTLFSGKAVVVASVVKFLGFMFHLTSNNVGLVPQGSYLPNPPILLWYLVEEIAFGVALAAILAFAVSVAKRKIVQVRAKYESAKT
jgi:hypothetical protein